MWRTWTVSLMVTSVRFVSGALWKVVQEVKRQPTMSLLPAIPTAWAWDPLVEILYPKLVQLVWAKEVQPLEAQLMAELLIVVSRWLQVKAVAKKRDGEE